MNKLIALFATLLGTVISAAAADVPYRHVVLFKFKDGAPAADIAKVEQAFVALKRAIPEIKALEWGTNVSPEGLANGFTHCFFVTFKDKAALERYLPHPEHKKFGAQLNGLLDKVLVIDYVAR
jgi:hypothetical protein